MGLKVLANRNQINYGIKSLMADKLADMKNLSKCAAGTTVYCIETQKKYMMDTKGYWRVAAGLGGGNGIDFGSGDLVFDGTEISDESDSGIDTSFEYIWDGGTVTSSNSGTNNDDDAYVWDGGNAAGN